MIAHKKSVLRIPGGIVVPIISPCDADGVAMDWDGLERQFEYLIKRPIDGLYLCGGTGDAECLLPEERRKICELLAPKLKKAGKSAIVHVGYTDLRTALGLATHAAEHGADAVAAVPHGGSWRAAGEYYRELTKVGLPVMLYYIPGATGMTAGFAEIAGLMEIPGVEGIKVSDWNTFLIRQIKTAYPDKTVFSGFCEMLLPGLSAGADGSIGTWANVFPGLYAKTLNAVKQGDWDTAIMLSERFSAFLTECWRYGVFVAFEEIMRLKGFARCFRNPRGWPPAKIEPDEVKLFLSIVDALEQFA